MKRQTHLQAITSELHCLRTVVSLRDCGLDPDTKTADLTWINAPVDRLQIIGLTMTPFVLMMDGQALLDCPSDDRNALLMLHVKEKYPYLAWNCMGAKDCQQQFLPHHVQNQVINFAGFEQKSLYFMNWKEEADRAALEACSLEIIHYNVRHGTTMPANVSVADNNYMFVQFAK